MTRKLLLETFIVLSISSVAACSGDPVGPGSVERGGQIANGISTSPGVARTRAMSASALARSARSGR